MGRAFLARSASDSSETTRQWGDHAMNCQDYLYQNADPRQVTRRWFFEQCGVGLGAMALGHLLQQHGYAAEATQPPTGPQSAWRPGLRNSAPKAKRVLFLFMAGAPSHLEMFDNRPQLAKFDGTLPPAELIKGYRAAFIRPNSKLLGPKFPFARHGQSGRELSALLPHLATVVDDIAVVKGMVTDAFNHAPGQIMMSTGAQIFGRPSIGRLGLPTAWGASRRIFRGSSCSVRGTRDPAAATRTGAAASYPPSTRASSSAAAATRCCISPTPVAWTTTFSATASTRSGSSTSSGSNRWVIPRSPRASTRSRWPSGCSSPRRT